MAWIAMPLICSVRSAHGVMKLRIPTVVGLGVSFVVLFVDFGFLVLGVLFI